MIKEIQIDENTVITEKGIWNEYACVWAALPSEKEYFSANESEKKQIIQDIRDIEIPYYEDFVNLEEKTKAKKILYYSDEFRIKILDKITNEYNNSRESIANNKNLKKVDRFVRLAVYFIGDGEVSR